MRVMLAVRTQLRMMPWYDSFACFAFLVVFTPFCVFANATVMREQRRSLCVCVCVAFAFSSDGLFLTF